MWSTNTVPIRSRFTVGLNPNNIEVGNANKGYILVIVISLLFAACSVQNSYRTLSFFFDDVPNPDEENISGVDNSLDAATDSSQLAELVTSPVFIIHQPYLQKECSSCHNQARMGSLTNYQPELCYQCHTDFGDLFTFEHGPTSGGYCTECHNPHRAIEQKLLVQPKENLCISCHNATQVSESIFHTISEESDCIVCHNPHGGDNHSLLQKGACYQCHENYNENFFVVHGPVAAGMCSACHTTHREGSEALLKKPKKDLCLLCHDAERLSKNENHPQIEDNFCTDCHNPHASERKVVTY